MLDTSESAHKAQVGVYRRLGAEERLALAMRMCDEARTVAEAGIRTRHPEYTERQIEHAMFLLVLKEALYRKAWPAEPLTAP